MADEQQTPGIDDVTSPEFDWGKFFESDDEDVAAPAGSPPVAAAATPAPAPEYEDEDTASLKNEISELKKMVADTAKVATEISVKNRITVAVEAWRQQASPAERTMEDVLLDATSLEDLQQKASLVKRVASSQDKVIAAERERLEREMQKSFGLPVTPTFSPVPDSAEYEQAIKDGDLDKAAALALKGVFNT